MNSISRRLGEGACNGAGWPFAIFHGVGLSDFRDARGDAPNVCGFHNALFVGHALLCPTYGLRRGR